MTHQSVSDDSPASALFPEFSTLYDLIAREVEGLTDEQLDWTSDAYDWAEWSIRSQVSHMASLIYRWLILRWGDRLFPNADHGVSDVQGIAASPNDRRMDDSKYYDLPVILEKLNEGIRLIQRVSGRAQRPLPACSHRNSRQQVPVDAHAEGAPDRHNAIPRRRHTDHAARSDVAPHILRRGHAPV